MKPSCLTTLVLAIASLVLASACAPNDLNSPPEQHLGPTAKQNSNPDSVDGGNSGGGGNTRPKAPPATTDMIRETIQYSRLGVANWLHLMEFLYRSNDRGPTEENGYAWPLDQNLMKLLFDSKPNVYDRLNKLTVELENTAPCKSDGLDVDGSIHAHTPGAICMSLSRLASKLTVEDQELQVDALIIHELTHLVGGDENEAVTVQQLALQGLGGKIRVTAYEKLLMNLDIPFQNTDESLAAMLDFQKENANSRFHLGKSVTDEYAMVADSVFNVVYEHPPVTWTEFDTIRQMINRSYIFTEYLCASATACTDSWMKTRYSKIFGSKKSMTVDDYMNARSECGPSSGVRCHSHMTPMTISRIDTQADLKKEIEVLRQFNLDLRLKAEQLEDDVVATVKRP